MTITKPMLAGKCSDITKLKFPVLATPKLDGIRCLIIPGSDGKPRAVSRNWKPIPNEHVRFWLENNCPIGFDGELVSGDTFQHTSSAIMTRGGEPEFEYQVFDYVRDPEACYGLRMSILRREFELETQGSPIRLVIPVPAKTVSDLEEFEGMCLTSGYEGVMVRTPNSPYKCGRSTEREGYLLKIKRFEDSEAIIVGFEEKMHNANEAKLDELGRTKRTSHKANKEGMDTLGALMVKDLKTGVTFRIGTGFDDELRDKLWSMRKMDLIGKIVKYKHQPSGTLDKPRFPVYLGLRSSIE